MGGGGQPHPTKIEEHQDDLEDEQALLNFVCKWEAELCVRTCSRHDGDEVKLMQTAAGTPLSRELSRLQECLEALPLVVQATRAKMLAHRVCERYPSGRAPESAEALLAVASVYQEGVAPHKLLPDNGDFAWTRDRWQCLERLLPAAEDVDLQAETIEDSVPDPITACRDFTAMQYQRE